MFSNIKKIITSKNAMRKILFTFFALVITRILTNLPSPGINRNMLDVWINSNEMKSMGIMDILSGNTMQTIAIGAIGISSYISASIIIQLLTAGIPYLNTLTKLGKEGTDKIKKITFISSLVISFIQSIFLSIKFYNYGLFVNGISDGILVVVSLILGSIAIYGLSKIIDEYGIGNGISFIIATNVAQGLYKTFGVIYEMFIENKSIAFGLLNLFLALLLISMIIIFIIYYNNGEKRIGVTYPGSNRYMNADKTYLPIKPSMCGVMPAIMAVSLFSMISMISTLFNENVVIGKIFNTFNMNKWLSFQGLEVFYNIGIIFYVGLIVCCSYLYSKIVFNSQQVADELRLSGGIINGVRQDKISNEIEKQTKNVLLIGGLGMAIIMLIPIVIAKITGIQSISIGGTSLIILVSVASDLSKRIMADAKIENDTKISFRGKGRKINVKTY